MAFWTNWPLCILCILCISLVPLLHVPWTRLFIPACITLKVDPMTHAHVTSSRTYLPLTPFWIFHTFHRKLFLSLFVSFFRLDYSVLTAFVMFYAWNRRWIVGVPIESVWKKFSLHGLTENGVLDKSTFKMYAQM